ncbi:MAG: glycosyltransferase family 25 protein [Micropepsaceae bacterium]
MSIPIHVINLRKDEERLSHVSQQLERLGLAFERVEAVHGLNLLEWLRPYFLDDNGAPGSGLLPGEIGCYASHLLVCAMVAERGQAAVVLEDDVGLAPDFGDLLETLSSLPAGWDIIRLSNPHKRRCVTVRRLSGTYNLVKFTRVSPSTGAYLISPGGARKFLSWKLLRSLPVDQDLRRTWDCGLRTYGVSPRPVEPDVGTSTIDAMHQRSRKKLRKMFGIRDYMLRTVHEISWLGFRHWLASRIYVGSRDDNPRRHHEVDGEIAKSRFA